MDRDNSEVILLNCSLCTMMRSLKSLSMTKIAVSLMA